MDNQFSVLILRMEYLVATSPYSKIVVLRSLYYRFQIGIGRSTSCIRQWSTLDSMFDLFQVLGSNVFAGIWNGLRFEIDMSVVTIELVVTTVESVRDSNSERTSLLNDTIVRVKL